MVGAGRRWVTASLLSVATLALGVPAAARAQPTDRVERLASIASLPPAVVGRFREPMAYQEAPNGDRYVFDRAGHSVYRITPDGTVSRVVQVGPEQGRLLSASSFDLGPSGRFVVADAPRGRERVQLFSPDGTQIGSFRLPGRSAPRLRIGTIVVNGIGSLQFTGRTILMNQPELGGLISEFSLQGHPFRTFGVFRGGPGDEDRDVRLALNTGLPLLVPDGGYYFVFQSGIPLFRKFDATGRRLFERHIEGPELDPIIGSLPTTWPRRTEDDGQELPVVPATVRTAAVDPTGHLWVALTLPVVYVYAPDGEKVRTLQLRGAGIVPANSLAFTARGTLLVTPGAYEFDVW